MTGAAGARKIKQAGKLPVDKTMVTVIVLLLLFGFITLFSATYFNASTTDPFSEMRKQMLGLALGLIAMQVTLRVPYRFFGKWQVVFLFAGVSLLLLVLVLIPGIGKSINGSRRWIGLGPLSFQPGEVAKYACVLFLAFFLTIRQKEMGQFFRGIVPMLLLPGLMFLIILEQPNLSTAGTVIIVSVLMILLSGAKWKHMGVLGVMGSALFAYYAWSAPYRRERLLSFTDPFAKMSDEGYQLSQSLIAFGSGGLFGMGMGQGRQKFAYLPYPESDFIFAVVGEDFGLVGCLAVILLFVCFLFCGLRIAVNCPDQFGCLLCAGIVTLISVQAFINMGVVVGILPTTGLPLPFFSAGGTSLSITLAAVGVVLNISRTARHMRV
ncbi:MAG: putative lipid II flippase FtsW [Clostridiales bacterium]|nr:putative lipid II flippase FtsW [Clostridiales bacterium]